MRCFTIRQCKDIKYATRVEKTLSVLTSFGLITVSMIILCIGSKLIVVFADYSIISSLNQIYSYYMIDINLFEEWQTSR